MIKQGVIAYSAVYCLMAQAGYDMHAVIYLTPEWHYGFKKCVPHVYIC